MKNRLLYFIWVLTLVTTVAFAQSHRDAEPGAAGIDTMSIVIGLVVGLIIGYLLGSRMVKR